MMRNPGDDVVAYDMITDPNGYVYVAGAFTGTVDFDPGAGVFNLTASAFTDAFLQKLDTNGNFIWAVQFAGADNEETRSVIIDATGNVYAIGFFTGTTDFNPGPGVSSLAMAGIWDQFIVKLTPAGTFMWVNRTGNPGCLMMPEDSRYDPTGFIYIAGRFQGTVDFNPGGGVANLTSNSFEDAFVQKLDLNGTYAWARVWGGNWTDHNKAISIGPGGQVISTGLTTSATTDYDPGFGNYSLTVTGSPGTQDYYIQRMTNAGVFVSAAKMGGNGTVMNGESAVDASGAIVVGGLFNGIVDVDPGGGMLNFSSIGSYDGFVVKLDASNALLWAFQLSATDYMEIWGVTIDPYGYIYIAGDFAGTVDFDPGPAVVSRTTNGGNCFVLKLTTNGSFVWLATTENNADASQWGLELDNRLNVYVCGDFNGNEDFDPQATTFSLNASGSGYAAHVYKLRQIDPIPLDAATLHLTAQANAASIHLQWTQMGVDPSTPVQVWRSENGVDFSPLGTSPAQAMNDHEVVSGKTYYYRLSCLLPSGHQVQSEVASAFLPQTEPPLQAFPNPVAGLTRLTGIHPGESIKVVDARGLIVFEKPDCQFEEWVDASAWAAGLYWVQSAGRSLLLRVE